MTLIAPTGSGAIRVLSIDGGGTRGLIPARLLAALERELGCPHRDTFDVIAGTSTGALIAAGLCRPDRVVQAETIATTYKNGAAAIFPRPRKLLRLPHRAARPPEFDRILGTYVGSTCLLRDAAVELAIPALNMNSQDAVLFTRAEARARESSLTLAEVVLASSAAPTYLPAVPLAWNEGAEGIFVDGGLFANNPALLVATALRGRFPRRPIRVLSLGCGAAPAQLPAGEGRLRRWALGDGSDFTQVAWMRHLAQTCMDASGDAADDCARVMLGDSYLRVQPGFEEGERPPLDDSDSQTMDRVAKVADATWAKEGARIKKFVLA